MASFCPKFWLVTASVLLAIPIAAQSQQQNRYVRTVTAVSSSFNDLLTEIRAAPVASVLADCADELQRGLGKKDKTTYPSDRLNSLDRAEFCLDEMERTAIDLARVDARNRANERIQLRSNNAAGASQRILEIDAEEADANERLAIYRLRVGNLRNVIDDAQRDNENQKDFLGLSWGIGVGISSTEDIVAANIDGDGIVRVSEKTSQKPRLILEMHYYGFCRLQKCKDGVMGIGPFTGVAGSNNTLESIALGVMFGWRDSKSDQADAYSFGIGAVLDTKVRRLGSGYVEGQAAPAGGSMSVPLEGRSRWSPLLFFTYTF